MTCGAMVGDGVKSEFEASTMVGDDINRRCWRVGQDEGLAHDTSY